MKNFSEDEKFMSLAFKLAKKALGKTSPNPLVGAVIVKDGKIIGKGYHKKAGFAHAEIEAINSCKNKDDLIGSKMYVTLEPCCFFGKTPPCTEAIIKAGIKEVIASTLDPNPKVNGLGLKRLENAGIKIKTGILSDLAKKQNEIFFNHITKGIPFVTAKIAASIDGKTATKTGDSKWITSEKSRNHVKKLRYEHDCVLTGINTVLTDNPTLLPTKNLKRLNKKYFRVILDSQLRININSNIIKTADTVNTIIFTSENFKNNNEQIFKSKETKLKNNNITIISVPSVYNRHAANKVDKNLELFNGFINSKQIKNKIIKKTTVKKIEPNNTPELLDLNLILKILYNEFEITSILLESGKTLFTNFLKNNLIDKIIFFIAPKIIGSDSIFGITDSLNILKIDDAVKLKIDKSKKIGEDIQIICYL